MPLKLLYITGWGRSGSTLLARILGDLEGFFHGGELRTIWTDGFKPSGQCGCGVAVKDCPIWRSIVQVGFGGSEQIDPKAYAKLRLSCEPKTQDLLLSQWGGRSPAFLIERTEAYRQVLQRLYSAMRQVSQSRVVVDDSLHPGYGYVLAHLSNVQVYGVHLIRDPRATAYSWQKRIKQGLGTYSIRDNSLGWMLRNLAAEGLRKPLAGRYLQVRYEDFAMRPRQTVQQILDFMDESESLAVASPFCSDHEVTLGIGHTVFGNANRTQTGAIAIRLDEQWKRDFSWQAQAQVTSLTFPLLLKYGYWGR